MVAGEVGSGKTLIATRNWILPHIAKGGVVCTNVAIRLYPWSSLGYRKSYRGAIQVLRDVFKWEFQSGQLVQLPTGCYTDIHKYIPEGRPDLPVLVVLDEALEGYDSLERGDNAGRLKETLSFFRHCRKLRVNLLLITQVASEINNRIRSKATRIWSVRDTNKMRVPVIRLPWPIRNMILAQYWSKNGKELLQQEYVAKTKWAYESYETDDMSLSSVHCGLGLAVDFRGKGKLKGVTMKSWERVLLFVSCLLAVYSAIVGRRVVIERSPGESSTVVSPGVGGVCQPADSSNVVERVRYVPFTGYCNRDGLVSVWAGGQRYFEGVRTYEGKCEVVSEYRVLLLRDDGTILEIVDSGGVVESVSNAVGSVRS